MHQIKVTKHSRNNPSSKHSNKTQKTKNSTQSKHTRNQTNQQKKKTEPITPPQKKIKIQRQNLPELTLITW
jgi:hypothetical protein